jgi:site-specific DNA recombinase
VLTFFAERVLGPERHDLLAADLDHENDDTLLAWQEQLLAMERTLTDLDTRRARLIQALETTDDPDGALAQDVNRRLTEISQQQHTRLRELQHHRSYPPEATNDAAELLARVGHLTESQLEAAPDDSLRRLFDAFALTVHYHAADSQATVAVTLDDTTTPAAVAAVAALGAPDGPLGTTAGIAPAAPGGELGICVARSEGFEPPTF